MFKQYTLSEKLVKLATSSALEKQGEDILILNMETVTTLTDFFLIISATSEPHLKALANVIKERIKLETNLKPEGEDGNHFSRWIALDYKMVIIHILDTKLREIYQIEKLWHQATKMDIQYFISADES